MSHGGTVSLTAECGGEGRGGDGCLLACALCLMVILIQQQGGSDINGTSSSTEFYGQSGSGWTSELEVAV